MRSAAVLGQERMEVLSRKFYAQRNMYLCGFTLFLSLILNRTYVLQFQVLRQEEQLQRLRGKETATGGERMAELEAENARKEELVSDLEAELKRKDANISALRSQMDGLMREYNAVGDQMAEEKVAKKDR